MRAGKPSKHERGGSMIWVAVLMLSVPAMILATVNLGRIWQGYRALRLATDAACQAAADGGLDAPVFQYMGEAVIDDYRARSVGRAVFLQVLQPYLGKTLQAPQITFRFQDLARVSCDGRAVVIPFGDLTTLLQPPPPPSKRPPIGIPEPWPPGHGSPGDAAPGRRTAPGGSSVVTSKHGYGFHLRVVTESWLRASPLH